MSKPDRQRRMWIFWEAIAPSRPKWLHMALCPYCRGYVLSRREFRRYLEQRP